MKYLATILCADEVGACKLQLANCKIVYWTRVWKKNGTGALFEFFMKSISAARVIYLTMYTEDCNFKPKAVVVGR